MTIQCPDDGSDAGSGNECYEAKGRNSGNSRNGHAKKKIRTSVGAEAELEDKIITMYAKGMSTRDITDALQEMYGMEVSAQTLTTKIMPLEAIYPIIYLDALYFNLKKEHKVESQAVYIVLGITLDGHKDVLGAINRCSNKAHLMSLGLE